MRNKLKIGYFLLGNLFGLLFLSIQVQPALALSFIKPTKPLKPVIILPTRPPRLIRIPVTPTIIIQPTPTSSITPTPTSTPTITPSPTATYTPTPSNTPTNTPVPTNTQTPTPTLTNTPTPTPTDTPTPTSSPTVTPFLTPTPTITPTPDLTPFEVIFSSVDAIDFDKGTAQANKLIKSCTYGSSLYGCITPMNANIFSTLCQTPELYGQQLYWMKVVSYLDEIITTFIHSEPQYQCIIP